MSSTIARLELVGRRISPGVNDLATLQPELLKSWNFARNSDITPEAIGAGSSKSVWWICSAGHEWQAIVGNRSKGVGCPVCAGKRIEPGFNDLKSKSPNIAEQWHPKKNYPLSPQDVGHSSNKKFWWLCQNGHEWEASPNARTQGRGCPVCANKSVLVGSNDLETTDPELASEFDFSLNSGLRPFDLVAGSNKTIWWRCKKGHSWKNSVNNRSRGQGCPYCSGRAAIPGVSDLRTLRPELAAEWNTQKNGSVAVETVSPQSGKKYWWHCSLSHEWCASVQDRWNGNGCPYCGGKKALAGFNDLGSLRPDLAIEIVGTDEQPSLASLFTLGSSKKLNWKCNLGHVYSASIYKRANGQGCPYCSNAKVLAGFNDLESQHPEIAQQIHPTRNATGVGKTLVGQSNKKIWWRCDMGHEWQTTPEHRIRGRGCPTCAVSGYVPTKPGYFYFIKNQHLAARKVGIANRGSKRIDTFRQLGWVVISKWESEDGQIIQTLETQILRWIRKDLGLPQYLTKQEIGKVAGWSETFSEEGASDFQVISKIEQVLDELNRTDLDRP
jgi:hypothetical protein